MITLKQVRKSYDEGNTYAVRDVSLEVEEGETLVLLGTSGSGKTTLLKMVNRLIELSAGSIEVDGRDIQTTDSVALRRSIGYVFQGIGLFPHLTVAKNICMIPSLLGWPKSKQRARARELLELVELEPNDYADRLPLELSGGQQQRVGVARALATSPKYLLMDEPFGALDAITRDTLQQQILQIQKRVGVTIIFVTHDIFEALTVADRIAVLHEGHLEQIDTKEQLLKHPKCTFVRELFEKPAKQLSLHQDLL